MCQEGCVLCITWNHKPNACLAHCKVSFRLFHKKKLASCGKQASYCPGLAFLHWDKSSFCHFRTGWFINKLAPCGLKFSHTILKIIGSCNYKERSLACNKNTATGQLHTQNELDSLEYRHLLNVVQCCVFLQQNQIGLGMCLEACNSVVMPTLNPFAWDFSFF